MAAYFSTEFLSEPGVTFAVTLLLFAICVSRERQVFALLIGSLGIAIGILFRTDSVLLLMPLAVLLLTPTEWTELLRWRPIRLLALTPIAVALAWVAWYDWYRFGSVFTVGYANQGFHTPFWRGMNLLVAAPGRGFFWFNLILVPGLVGAVLVWKTSWRIGAAIAYGCLARLLFYAKWDSVAGGVTWGPRFLLPCCALLTIGLGETLERTVSLARRSMRLTVFAGVAVLAGLSAVVAVASWWVPYEQVWRRVSTPAPGESARQVESHIHDYYYSVTDGEIIATMRLFGDAKPLAAERLRGGLSSEAVAGLVAALSCCALAVVLSWGRSGTRGPPWSGGAPAQRETSAASQEPAQQVIDTPLDPSSLSQT
jgi:hypothetical protein